MAANKPIAPGEPLYLLQARDPLAGFLVSICSSIRMGAIEAAQVKFAAMCERAAPEFMRAPDVDEATRALDVALQMFAWRGGYVDEAARG